ncbi:MAG: ATP-binding protein, partial [Betaproteobacteria bacterium]
MDAAALARAKSVINPFVSNRVDSAWDADSVDVEAINRTAFERCAETIGLVRNTKRCRGLLLSGEPGSGKTHLLQRLRRHVQRDGRDCFVYVPPVSGPDRFFRDLLQHTVQDLVGSRTGSASSQLETLLVRELLGAESRVGITAAFWVDVRKRHPPGPALFSWLEARMEQLCSRLQLDPAVTRVLQHYLAEHRRSDAYSWLLGRSISEEVLVRLGVSHTLEEDADALHALVTLSRLAGAHSVLVLAFDQLEGLQVDAKDQLGLRAFAAGLAKLFVECRNVATISCVQSYFKQDLESAVPPANMQRLAQDQGALTLLQKDSAIRLVAERLAAIGELQEARLALGTSDVLWPLRREDVEQATPAGGISARKLLDHCRQRFEDWRRGESVAPRATESLDEIWESRMDQAAAASPDEGVMADGLLKLLDARSPGTSQRAMERDVDVVLSTAAGDIGVAVCHAENMTSLAARLRRLQTLAESGRFKRMAIVRDQRLRISPTAKATQERLNALRDGPPYYRTHVAP